MTKLQLLHRALNERLMAAVEQIMEMVGGTVLEYEEETVRARKENEILRRRLRWMEGENPTDWPDPVFSVSCETSLTDTLALESLIIKTEPIDSHDFQLYWPDTSLTASVCTANIDVTSTSAPTDAGIPDSIVWDSAQSYMAPLDFDPTLSTMARNRSQRRSFACPDCGKVFGREQRLMFHMRIHSTERPYTYRRRKTCFYGDKERKKLRGLSKTSREFIEDLSDTSGQTEQSTGSATVGISASAGPSAPEAEPSEASDEASEHTSSSKLSETSAARPVGLKSQQGREKPKTAQCLQCNKAFTNVSRLAVHMKTHRKPLPSQDEQNLQGDTESGLQHLPKEVRNNETEVEKAKAISQRLFQCPECKKIFARSCWLSFHLKSHKRERKRQKKKQLQNNKLKDVQQVSEKPKKDVATDSSKVQVLKKIFACPYCDKVFAREGWLGPHIRNHTVKNQNSDVISDAILPNSTKRRTRRVVTKANALFTEVFKTPPQIKQSSVEDLGTELERRDFEIEALKQELHACKVAQAAELEDHRSEIRVCKEPHADTKAVLTDLQNTYKGLIDVVTQLREEQAVATEAARARIAISHTPTPGIHGLDNPIEDKERLQISTSSGTTPAGHCQAEFSFTPPSPEHLQSLKVQSRGRPDRYGCLLFRAVVPQHVYAEWALTTNWDGSRGKCALPVNLRHFLKTAVSQKFPCMTSADRKRVKDRVNEFLRSPRNSVVPQKQQC